MLLKEKEGIRWAGGEWDWHAIKNVASATVMGTFLNRECTRGESVSDVRLSLSKTRT